MRDFPSDLEILKVFTRNPEKTFRLRELVVDLGLRSSQARDLKHTLKDLARDRKIVYLKKNHFALVTPWTRNAQTGPARHGGDSRALPGRWQDPPPAPRNLVSGRLIGHRDGYGFVVADKLPDSQIVGPGGRDRDIFIPPNGMGSALHGDRVEVLVFRKGLGERARSGGRYPPGWTGRYSIRERPERLEGRVIRVIERAQKTVVGEFHYGSRYNYVLPYDHRIPREIVIPRGEEWPLEESEARNRQFGGESEADSNKRRGGSHGSKDHRSARDLDGLIVDVEITSFSAAGSLPQGRVFDILGRRDDFGVDVEIIIRKFHLPHRFPAEVLEEAELKPQYVSEGDRHLRQGLRRDFRDLPIVTIDGETAKDFDDAVHVQRLPGGKFLLQVHIADVAHYVRPGSGLDREARLRGTSVYFPDRAVPMLPLELSNGVCSLNPHVDRLVMSALMEIGGSGRLVTCQLTPGVIRSAERITYTAVNAVLNGDPELCLRYRAQVEHFKLMEELARILNRRREERGSIDFDLPEPVIEFDQYGRMVGMTRSERNIAHRIIEEFMLVANETVASFLESRGAPTLYRVHERPEPKKVIEFEEIAATFGYSLGVTLPAARRVRVKPGDDRNRYPRFREEVNAEEFQITPQHYQRLTERIAGKPEERILSYLMLRSLKQARYSEENLGHFALASPTYTHFTSPIRRYPDLIVHRVLKAVLEKEGGSARIDLSTGQAPRKATSGPSRGRAARLIRQSRDLEEHNLAPGPQSDGESGGAFVDPEELHLLGLETSESERRAADAERELMEWKKVAFMAGRLGDEFEALIISITKNGFFVELTDLFVEGFVPLESFEDDRYIYRESQRALVGERSKRAYHLGDRVRAQLDRIDRAGNRLQFSVAEQGYASDPQAP